MNSDANIRLAAQLLWSSTRIFFDRVDQYLLHVLSLGWSPLLVILSKYWLLALLVLALILALAYYASRAGRWGTFSRVAYNYLFFGTLFGIGVFWGPETVAGGIFRVLGLAIIYTVGYRLVRRCLKETIY